MSIQLPKPETSPDGLSGGKSVFCINELQLRKALELADPSSTSGPRIHRVLEEVEQELDRNERAALAFLLVDRLMNTAG